MKKEEELHTSCAKEAEKLLSRMDEKEFTDFLLWAQDRCNCPTLEEAIACWWLINRPQISLN